MHIWQAEGNVVPPTDHLDTNIANAIHMAVVCCALPSICEEKDTAGLQSHTDIQNVHLSSRGAGMGSQGSMAPSLLKMGDYALQLLTSHKSKRWGGREE